MDLRACSQPSPNESYYSGTEVLLTYSEWCKYFELPLQTAVTLAACCHYWLPTGVVGKLAQGIGGGGMREFLGGEKEAKQEGREDLSGSTLC